ncbi:MAG: D-ribose pyranase [Corynebacterium casei]|uniref:D-ribose pyranase n=1 Tax=Corynebacterium casei TaxID=160386 RepID=UPI002649E518|nr:D-ribose pyranase [Corynebacterium casei]MDN6694560.1 D-ribose pyranase [Corynebacterium casei]MDN6709745.1 D-ribose pyranase [Corynebacterium casei]
MLKRGLLNPQLNEALSHLGHTDALVFADAGLPLPKDVAVVDLSITFGLPSIDDVIRAVMAELVVEGATVASESPAEFVSLVQETGKLADTAVTYISHEELKASLTGAKLIIRTGDTTPFANVIFRCGVPF